VLVERFRREARAAAKIVHPNVVAIHDIGAGADERPFIVMEYVDGPTIAQLLAAGPLPQDPLRREADAVALGDELGQIAERLREKRLGF
jgi:serine/threonine protein kinase